MPAVGGPEDLQPYLRSTWFVVVYSVGWQVTHGGRMCSLLCFALLVTARESGMNWYPLYGAYNK